jgi:hypothetical protein
MFVQMAFGVAVRTRFVDDRFLRNLYSSNKLREELGIWESIKMFRTNTTASI